MLKFQRILVNSSVRPDKLIAELKVSALSLGWLPLVSLECLVYCLGEVIAWVVRLCPSCQ